MKRKLFLLLCALLTSVGTWAQGTWVAPEVPGIDPATVDGSTTYYLYNVGSDAFAAYGMNWQSQAIARRLSSGDQAVSSMHKMKATISDNKLSFHFDDVKDANRLLSDNGNDNNCYVDTWMGDATKFTFAASLPAGAYTLTNVSTGHNLDVHWAYGGHLTGQNGQGFTAWAIIPETSITNGSYAKYKEKKQMYGVYQALVAAGVVSSYTTALETANAVYVDNSSTVSQLRTATRTLINAAAEDIASSINGNSLFDDTDIWGNQALTTWTPTAASNSDYGEYETYNIHYDFDQTHDVPNGSYKIIFHSLFRNDGGGTAPRIIVTDGEKDGGGTSASANVPLFTSFDFTPTNNNSSGNMSVAKSGYFSDWVQNNNVWIPNGRRSSADAMAHTNAVASVDNFKVTTGKMNIRLIIDQDNQWVNFQGFDIVFYGSTTGKLYRDLVELLETANVLATQPMNATVLNDLNSAIAAYSNLSKSSSEEDLEAAIAAVTIANTNAETSINIYSSIDAAITEYAAKASTLDAAGQAAYDASGVTTKYNNGTYETLAEAETELQTALVVATKAQTTEGSDWTGILINPSFEENTGVQAPIGWTLAGTANGIQTQNNSGFDGFKVGTMFGERWSNSTIGDFDAYQTIEGMPSGVYELKAVATFNGTGGYLYANDIKAKVTEAKYYTVQVALDANSTLRVGVKNETSGNGSWFKCDDFTLKLVSAGLPDVTPVVGKMNAEVAAAQTTAVETYEADRTIANYNAAVAAIAAAQTSKDAYTTGKSALDKAKDIMDNTNVYTAAAYTSFNGAYTTAAAKYEASTWTNEEATGYNSTTFGTGWHSTASVDDFLISAWDANPRDWSTYHINTWSTTGDSGNPNLVTPCFEYWTGDNTTLVDKTMTATLGGFDPGATYKVTATVCVGVNTGVAASTAPTGVTLQLNDGEAVDVCAGDRIAATRFYEGTFEANATIGADGNLVIKLNVASTNASWITWRDVKYTMTAPASVSVTLDATTGYATFGSQYPLNLIPENLATGVKAYKATTVDGENITFEALEQGVPANTGILIAGEPGQEVTIPVATSTSEVEGNLLHVNASGTTFPAESGCSYYGLMKGTKEFRPFAPGTVAIPANKAYLRVENINPSRLVIRFDDLDPTAINAVEAAEANDGALKDGKYLIGNKVVLMKNGVKYGANGQKLN